MGEGVYMMGHRNWKPWRHSGTGGAVPAFGVFAVTGNEIRSGSQTLIGQLPGDESECYAVNGVRTLSASDPLNGIYHTGPEVLVRYDTGTPAVGEKFGPKSGEYTVSKEGSPLIFECMGVWDSTNKIMRARMGGGDELVKATSADNQSGYLDDKIKGDESYITTEVETDGNGVQLVRVNWIGTIEGGGLRAYKGTATTLASSDASMSIALTAIDGGADPVGAQTVYNRFHDTAVSGDPVLVLYDAAATQYVLVRVMAKYAVRMFSGTLPGTLSTTTEKLTCNLTAIDGGPNVSSVDVYNIRDNGNGGLHGVSGAPFRAILNQATSQYEFTYVPAEPLIRFYEGTLSGSLAYADATVTCSLTAIDGYSSPTVSPPSTVEGVLNNGFAGSNGTVCSVRKDASGNYKLTWVKPATQSVVTNAQVTSTTLQVKTRTEVAWPNADESDWTTIDTFTTSCP